MGAVLGKALVPGLTALVALVAMPTNAVPEWVAAVAAIGLVASLRIRERGVSP